MKAKGIYRRSLAQQVECGDLGSAPELRPEEREDREVFLEERTESTVPLDKERPEGGRGLRLGKELRRSWAHCIGFVPQSRV